MHGNLSEREIDAILREHGYGRVGFVLENEVYIIPINYAYDGALIYGQAPPGTKVEGMRQNPKVAFEVDEIQDPAHWRSVLVHGRFVELHDRAEKEAAFDKVLGQAPGGERSEVSWGFDLDHLVVFQIEVSARTGRFEQRALQDFGLPVERD